MSDGFLSRWARRKQEVARAERPGDAPPEEARAPAQEPAEELAREPAPPPDAEAAPDPDAVTPEELAALPPVEALDAGSDVTAFLRKGVPQALRNAALRRVWALDPAIRDYVSEAREYAYDWNVPGGVPGNGPMLPTDDVAAMVRKVFGDREPEAPETREASARDAGTGEGTGADAAAEPAGEETAPGDARGAADQEAEVAAVNHEAVSAEAPESVRLDPDPRAVARREAFGPAPQPAAAAASEPVPAPPATPRRRHGGAVPV
jgi:hypothetical protein